MIPIHVMTVAKNWAIHYIDENIGTLVNVKLELSTPSKEATTILSEIPYKCPNDLRHLTSSWSARRIHQTIMQDENDKKNKKDKKDKEEQTFFVQYFCGAFAEMFSPKDEPILNLKLNFFKDEDENKGNVVYAAIFDESKNIWTPPSHPLTPLTPLCFVWNDKNDLQKKLWSITNA